MSIASSPVTYKASKNPDLKALAEPVKEELALVEEWLGTNLIDDNRVVHELLADLFKAGGKRIRPLITLLCSQASNRQETEFSRLHIILAVLTELIHAASLVHDDVIDRASVRRGQQTVNRRFNDRLAVLLGDLLFAQASICLARIMNPVVVGIYGQVLGDLCSGEIRQMNQQFSTAINWDAYLRKSVCKTASLFAAGSHSGAILNGCAPDVVSDLKQFGLNLGLCFQIVDDLLDVTGKAEELGKEPGSDLRSGVITAPALFVLEQKTNAAERLAELIKNRLIITDEGTAEAIDLIRNNGGIEKTIELAQKYAQLSVENLQKLPNSTYKNSLEQLADYILIRTK
jgi:all-trans-nonaprenyl-diphosphate synthase